MQHNQFDKWLTFAGKLLMITKEVISSIEIIKI
jgi:hypothetical protein